MPAKVTIDILFLVTISANLTLLKAFWELTFASLGLNLKANKAAALVFEPSSSDFKFRRAGSVAKTFALTVAQILDKGSKGHPLSEPTQPHRL